MLPLLFGCGKESPSAKGGTTALPSPQADQTPPPKAPFEDRLASLEATASCNHATVIALNVISGELHQLYYKEMDAVRELPEAISINRNRKQLFTRVKNRAARCMKAEIADADAARFQASGLHLVSPLEAAALIFLKDAAPSCEAADVETMVLASKLLEKNQLSAATRAKLNKAYQDCARNETETNGVHIGAKLGKLNAKLGQASVSACSLDSRYFSEESGAVIAHEFPAISRPTIGGNILLRQLAVELAQDFQAVTALCEPDQMLEPKLALHALETELSAFESRPNRCENDAQLEEWKKRAEKAETADLEKLLSDKYKQQFANSYQNFGSRVTALQAACLQKKEGSYAAALVHGMKARWIQFSAQVGFTEARYAEFQQLRDEAQNAKASDKRLVLTREGSAQLHQAYAEMEAEMLQWSLLCRQKINEEKRIEEEKRRDAERQRLEERRRAEEEVRKEAERKRADEQRRLEEEKKRIDEEKKQLDEEKRAYEEKRKEAERKRLEEQRKLEEEKRKEAERKRAEEQRRAEEEKKRIEEEKRLDEEKRKEAERKRVEEQRKLDEEKRRADEEKRRVDEEKRKEAERKRLEEQRKLEEEKRRLEEEKQRLEEEKRVNEEKRKEAERKRVEEQRKLEEERKRIEEEKRKEAERKRVEEQRRAEEERQRIAEEKRLELERKRLEEKRAQEEKRLIEEKRKEAERKRLEEQRQEAERKRLEEQRRAEEQRQRLEEQRKEADRKRLEEQRRVEEERRRIAEEKRRIEEERRRIAEEKRQEELRKKEELRQRQIEERRKLLEEKRRLEEERRKEIERKRLEQRQKLEEEKRRQQEERDRIENDRHRRAEELRRHEAEKWRSVDEKRARLVPPLWNHLSSSHSWTNAVLSVVRSRMSALERARDVNLFCPGYHSAEQHERENCWLMIISGISKRESSFNPGGDFVEGTGVASIGLLALSAGECRNAPTAKSLTNAVENLKCGTELFARFVGRDGVIDDTDIGSDGQKTRSSRGAAAYWSTLSPRHRVYHRGLRRWLTNIGHKDEIMAHSRRYKNLRR